MIKIIWSKIIRTGIFGVWWETKDGRTMLIRRMDDKHLVSAIRYLRRRAKKMSKDSNYGMLFGGKTEHIERLSIPEDFLPAKFRYLVAEANRRGLDFEIKKQMYYRQQEQCNCPNCNKIVITPPVHLTEGESLPLLAESHCPWCGTKVGFNLWAHPKPHEAYIIHTGPTMKALQVWRQTWSSTGVQGTTDVVIKFHDDGKYEARVGLAIFGTVNNEASMGANPFDPLFHDNYAKGFGASVDEAVEALRADCESMTKSLWAE